MKKLRIEFLALVLSCATSFATAQVDTITILHFNDTHSVLAPIGPRDANLNGSLGGIARAATLVGKYRSTDRNVLLLHAGDISIGDVFNNTTYGVAELQMMLGMGFDAMTLGNHEFDLTPATLLQALSAAFAQGSFPILSANLVLDDPAVAPLKNYVSSYAIKEFGKTRVGIFGLTTPLTNFLSNPSPAFVDTNVIADAVNLVDTLSAKGCQVIVCLSHLGVQLDQLLASYVPGITVIVGGHDHYATPNPIEVINPLGRRTMIVQANAFYLNMGRMQLAVGNGQVYLLGYDLITIDSKIAPDPTSSAAVEGLKQSIEGTYGPVFSQQIGYAESDFVEVSEMLQLPGRKDTPIGNLVTDAFRAAAHTDIGFEVGGSTAMQLWKGPIVQDDVFRVLGYGFNTDNGLGYRFATFKMTGEALLSGVQFCLSQSCSDDNDEFLAQVSGMSYRYETRYLSGVRWYELDTAWVGGRMIDPTKVYSVASNEFVPIILDQIGIPYSDLHVFADTTEFQVVAAYIAAHGSIKPIVEGRVVNSLTVGVAERNAAIPATLSLAQNYPNPFNPSTTITYDIPQPCSVKLTVFNVLGQEIAVLVSGKVQAGTYKVMFNANRLSSGAYFYSLKVGDRVMTKRMMLIK